MPAWKVNVLCEDSVDPGLSVYMDIVVSANTVEDAIAAIRAHKCSDPDESLTDIGKIERVGDEVIDSSGVYVRETR